ncbi:MAG: hypothetical protein AAFU53_11440, partial [Cyanobacteria bacterium J06632_3]
KKVKQQKSYRKQRLQKSNGFNKPAFLTAQRDAHTIIAEARQKPSPLKQRIFEKRNLKDENSERETSKTQTTAQPTLNFSEIAQALPQKIDEVKTQVSTSVQQQPERVKRVFVSAKDDLKKRSVEQLSPSINNAKDAIEPTVERTIKAPLRQLLKRIEDALHNAIKALS